jgi:hypothetical protein
MDMNAWETLPRQERQVIVGAGVAAAVLFCGWALWAVLSGWSPGASDVSSSAPPDQGFDLESAAPETTTTTTTTVPSAPGALAVDVPETLTDAPTADASTTTVEVTSTSSTADSSTTVTAASETQPPAEATTITLAPAMTSTTAGPTMEDPEVTTTEAAPTTMAPTTATTAAPTTMAPTTATTTAQRTNAPTFHGVKPFASFSQGTLQYDAWTSGDVVFYAPPGQVPVEDGLRWVVWYRRVDDLYRKLSTKDNFETYYRRNDANFGPMKVLGLVTTCGAGCGSKQQAEADPNYINSMVGDPTDPDEHWIFFYEMGRTGSSSFFEDWYGKATWPTNTLIMPHMMAAVGYYELGGETLLRNGNTKFLFEELALWEQENIEYVDQFPIPDQQTQNGYTSHHLIPAMLLTVMTENGIDTLEQVLENMSNEPTATDATQAMCDFQDAVNAATGGRYSARMKGEWGLPDNCP